MKKKLLAVALSASVLTGALPMTSTATEIEEKIQQKEQEITELKKQEQTLQTQLNDLQAEFSTLDTAAVELANEQQTLQQDIQQLTAEINQLTERIAKREAALQSQARDVQVKGTSTSYLSAVLGASSLTDVFQRIQAVTTIVNANNDLVKQQQADQIELQTAQAENQEKAQQLQENQVLLEAQKGALLKVQLDVEIIQADLAAQRAEAESEKNGYLEEKAAAQARKAQLQAQEEAAQALAVAAEQELAAAADPAASNETDTDNSGSQSPLPSAAQPAAETPNIPAPIEAPVISAPVSGNAIVAEAQKHLGKDYTQTQGLRQGPNSFDCSGLAWYVYKTVTGKDIGGWTVPQESSGTQIAVSQAQAGDLYFWGSRGGTYHVAIATGGGGYIHASTWGVGVVTGNTSSNTPSFAVRVA